MTMENIRSYALLRMGYGAMNPFHGLEVNMCSSLQNEP